MLKRNAKLIKLKFLQYLIPSILTSLALQVGNIVDTILVGNILGPDVMSAVQIGGTILLLIQIPGYMLGIGGSVAVGNLLGKRDSEGAEKVFSVSMTATVISGLVLMLISLFSGKLALMLAGDNSLTADVAAVIQTTFLGAPLIGIAVQMINYMAVDNHPKLSTAYVVLSNVINLTADYILLKYTSLGARGAVLSTLIGYTAAFAVIILYIRSPGRMLRFVDPFKGTGSMLKLAVITGIPSMLAIICEIIRNWTMNVIIINYAGETAVAVYTICLNLVLLCELFLGGITGTMSTIGGVLYGEKDYFGVRSLSKNIITFSYILLAVLVTLLFIFTRQAAALFGIQSSELMDMSVAALRIFIFCLPFYSLNHFMTIYFQTTEKPWISNIITIPEYCGVLLPSVMISVIIAKTFGDNPLNAIMTAFVADELITVLASVAIVKLKYKKDLFILSENNVNEILDISVSPELDEAVKVAQDITEFCDGKLDKSHVNRIAVAAEEMTVNTIKHGGKYISSIDIMLCLTNESALIRFRDNGTPFDPTEYSYDSEDYKFGEIEVMLKLADKVTYMRMLDFNNTIIEIKR